MKIDLKHKEKMRKELLNFRKENLVYRTQRLKIMDIIEEAKTKKRNLKQYIDKIEEILIEKGEEE